MKSVTRFCMRSPTPWRGPATENAPTDRDGNKICREIGAVPCASAKPDAIRVTTYRYLLRLKTTGEIVGKYHRRPSFAKYLKRMALKGRPETLGQLELTPYEE